MKRIMKWTVALAIAALAAQTASAGLITNVLGDRGDGMTVVQIAYDNSGDNTGTWSVPVGVSQIEVMVIGGGGAGARGGAFGSAGGTGGSPGGGAGGFYYDTMWSVTGGSSISLAVGVGAPTTTATGNGASGGNSVFGTIIAYGGQGGVYTVNQGGNQGGYSIDGGSNVVTGYLGGTGAGAVGGAGASMNGQTGGYRPSYGGAGVAATAAPITGSFGVIGADMQPITAGTFYTQIGYAGGGSAGYDGELLGAQYGESFGGGSGTEPEGQPGGPGFDTLGGGGGGGRSANGGAGGDGVIYIAYAIPEPATLGLLGVVGVAMLLRRRIVR